MSSSRGNSIYLSWFWQIYLDAVPVNDTSSSDKINNKSTNQFWCKKKQTNIILFHIRQAFVGTNLTTHGD